MKTYDELSPEALRGLEDLYFFGEYFCGLTPSEKPHREMCDALMWPETHPETPNVLMCVPRGAFKTSWDIAWVTRLFLRKYYLDNNAYHRVVIASATLPLGTAIMKAIEGLWRYGGKNGRIDEEYGKLWQNRTGKTEGSKTEDGITWAPRLQQGQRIDVKEPSIFVGSERRVSTGFHADAALFDDLNSDKNVRTDHQRKATQDYYRLIYPILDPVDKDGKPSSLVMTCTPWHDDDVRGMIIREQAAHQTENPNQIPKWHIYSKFNVEPFDDEANLFFPSRFPKEVLEGLRRPDVMSVRQFCANYLGDPRGGSGFVEEEQIVFKGEETFPAGDFRMGRISVDPNQHKDAKVLGCYAAIVVTAYDRFAKMYVLDARGSREWSTGQFIDELFSLQERYPYPIFMEDSHMSHFDHAVRMEEVKRSDKEKRLVRLRIHYTPIDYKATKYENWEKIQPRFKNRSIIFNDAIAPSIKAEIKDELVRGMASRYKDFLDALALAETGFRPRMDKSGQMIAVMPEKTLAPGEIPTISFAEALGPEWEGLTQ